MKFSELKEEDWAELQPYLDTCLLPVTGLNGSESPPEATEKAARAGDWLLPLETAFRGRTVTFPAYHYGDRADASERERLERYCARAKSAGYKYVILVSGEAGWSADDYPSADLIVAPQSEGESPDETTIRGRIASLWKKQEK